MAQFNQSNKHRPTKQQVRSYMEQRIGSRKPLPEMEEIRRQLGWVLSEIGRSGTPRKQ